MDKKTKRRLALSLQVSCHLGAFLPIVWLWWAIPRGLLGGDPVKELIHFLGMGALRLLLLSLLISPLVSLLRFSQLMRLRRPLGLWAFTYASLHIYVWCALDLGFEWGFIGAEIAKRTYILLGFVAWCILFILAITSIPMLIRKLKRRWKTLHRSVYLASVLVAVHFWWSVKSGWIEPAIYAFMLGLLLVFRMRRVSARNGAN